MAPAAEAAVVGTAARAAAVMGWAAAQAVALGWEEEKDWAGMAVAKAAVVAEVEDWEAAD